MSEVRVRFAPSPTGALHIGGVRTALYNYLFAKKMGGKMLLRIEDTDQTRFVEGAEEYIFDSLEWLGIQIDESARHGGDCGPYKQSERKPMYKEYAQRLVDEGKAYYAFDTSEELTAMRERLKAARVASPQYNSITRMQMKNSLTLPESDVKERLANGDPYVIRLKVPRKEEIRLNDMVRGWVMVHSSAIDDKVLMKSDGMPTYHLANVVDDHLMGITHVIRGEEWLPSAPLHVLLYQYLGWEDSMPQFAHLPLLLKPDGNGKLSKRDGDKLGFPVFPMNWHHTNEKGEEEIWSGFKESDYLPEAMFNFLAFLGWNPGTQQEIFTKEELIEAFSAERIGKSGVKFDIQKAKWFNEQYLRNMPVEDLVGFLKTELENNGISFDESKLSAVVALMTERAVFPKDLYEQGKFIFTAPTSYDEKVIRKKWNADVASVIEKYNEALANLEEYQADKIKQLFFDVLEANGMKMGQVMQSLRVVITGQGMGPDLMAIMEIIGKEEATKRIKTALTNIEVKA